MTCEPWSLPESWHWSTFADVAHVASDLVDPKGYPNEPHIAPNHIERETGRLLPFKTIAEDGVTSAKHRFSAGQILYSKIRPYLAKVVVVDFDGLCSADMYPVETELDPRFLKWWMLTLEFTRQAAGQQARTVLPKINKRALGMLPVPVPPDHEQRRIVDILEDHLSRLDAALTNLGMARSRSEGLLISAVLGNAYVKAAPTQPLAGLLAEPLANGRSVPTLEGGFPVLRLTALKADGIDLTERKGGSWTEADARRFLVRRGDFLVSRGNGSLRLVARGAHVISDPDPVAYPDTIIRIRMRPSDIVSEYMHLVWNSPIVRHQIESMARTTAGIYKVNQKHLESIRIPVPGLEQQKAVSEHVGQISTAADRLQDELKSATQHAESLRRVLMVAAFSGRLTGRNADMEMVEEMAGV